MNSNALKAQLTLQGKNVDDLIQELDKLCSLKLSKSAFYRKLNGTSEFDRKEILAISKVLEITEEQMVDIFFKEKVS